jgi:hypothetical protein
MASIIVTGYVVAVTDKSIRLEHDDDGREIWYSRNYSTVIAGCLRKGEWLSLSVPQWLYDKANGEQSAPPPPATQSMAGATVPPDMLKRLIQLCHPDKHDGSKASTTATEWLLQQRGRA